MQNASLYPRSFITNSTITIDSESTVKKMTLAEAGDFVRQKLAENEEKAKIIASNSLNTSEIHKSKSSCLTNTSTTTTTSTTNTIKIETKETAKFDNSESDTFESLSDSCESLSDSSEASTSYQIEKINISSSGLQQEDRILESVENLEIEENATEEHLNALNTLFHMATDFANINGTTIFSALSTIGTGLANAASDGYVQPLLGAVALGIGANEVYKMYQKYVNDKGASDHLKIIEKTFESLEKKNKIAQQRIKQAMGNQSEIKDDLVSTLEKIKLLESQLENTTQEFHESINAALNIQFGIKTELEEQYTSISNAISESEKASDIINNQIELLKEFKQFASNEEYLNQNTEDLIKEIKSKINEITAQSADALDHQTKATNHMFDALTIRGTLVKLNNEYLKVYLKLQIIEKKYKEAQELNTDIGNKLKETEEKVNELGANLEAADDVIEDQAILIEIGKDATEAEKQREVFGTESVNLGGMGAVLAGLGAGFITFGPPGAIAGVLAVGICGIKPAVKIAHLARKTLKSASETKLEEEFKACKAKFQSSNCKLSEEVTIEGKFGPSTAKLLFSIVRPWGTGGKNLGADINNTIIASPLLSTIASYTPLNFLLSPTPMEKILSHKGGNVNCTFGGIQFPELEFNVEDNHTLFTYGAISLKCQSQLSALFMELLMEDLVAPQQILDFLKKFESVKVETIDDDRQAVTKCICMISEKSKAMKSLKKACHKKISRETEKNEIKITKIVLERNQDQEDKSVDCLKKGAQIVLEIKK